MTGTPSQDWEDRTTISRADEDPLSQMIWKVWDTGRPMVVTVDDSGQLTTRFMDTHHKVTFAVGDRVRKQSNPLCEGTVTEAVVAADLYEVRWDRWAMRVFANNPYAGGELEVIS